MRDDGLEKWVELNEKYAEVWPNISEKRDAPADADEFKGVDDKFNKYFSEEPGTGS